jgi:hypothetical protein
MFPARRSILQSRGLIAPGNLVAHPNSIDNAAWTKLENTVVADAAAAPNGAMDADRLVPSAVSSANHFARYASITVAAGALVRATAYFKESGYPVIGLVVINAGTTVGIGKHSNLVTGAEINAGFAFGGASLRRAGRAQSSNGWTKIFIEGVVGAQTGLIVGLEVSADDALSAFSGDTVKGMYCWGVQLHVL